MTKMKRWTGPHEGELDVAGRWRGALPIPSERWPYGPPEAHEDCCWLHANGRFCDCAASDVSTEDEGDHG
jgi:hypothetical protein